MRIGLGLILIIGFFIVLGSYLNPEQSEVVAKPVNTKGLMRVTLAAG